MEITRLVRSTEITGNRLKGAVHFLLLPILCATAGFMHPLSASAQFNITGNTTSAQTITSGTGTVTSTGTISVAGTGQAVTISGGALGAPVELLNSGTIRQTGSGRAVQSANTGSYVVIQNNANAVISSTSNDTIAIGQGSTTVVSVSLNNAGTIQSAAGGQAVNFNKILSGSNTITNSGTITATNSDAARPGVNGIVNNTGLILSTASTLGSSDDGIDAQSNSGIIITNSGTGVIEGARHGITGGNTTATNSGSYALTISNTATIQGDDGSGVNIDGYNANEQVVITNSGTITGRGQSADGDGVDVDGNVNITNHGVIQSLNALNDTSEGITVGSGTIINTGTILGTTISGSAGTGVGRGITFSGVDKSAMGTGSSIPAQGIYGPVSVTNSGLIRGTSDSGITISGSVSGFSVNINNQAGGTIEGDGASVAAIQGSDDNTTITNSGTIVATQSGTAIDFGNGNNTLSVTGGVASIQGNIAAGTGTNSMTINPGAGNKFSYAGSISNFSSVAVNSGTVTFSGSNTYTGSTSVTGGRLVVDGSIKSSSNVTISAGASLGGSGSVGKISGAGTVSLGDPVIFTTTQVDPRAGMSFDFAFTQQGAPTYTSSTASGNDVLHITGSTPLVTTLSTGNTITIDFSAITGSLATGQIYQGGFFVDTGTSTAVGNPTFNYTGTGTFGIAYEGLVNVSTANFGTGTVNNGAVMEFEVIPEPSTWVMMIIGGACLLIFSRRRAKA